MVHAGLLHRGGCARLLVTQYDMKNKAVKITYTTPASVLAIITAYGTGTGIQNGPDGLWLEVTGKTYPKGTVFEVKKGSIKEFSGPQPTIRPEEGAGQR